MNPVYRKVRSLIWLGGASMILLAFLDLAVYWAKCRSRNLPLEPWPCVARAAPVVLGGFLFWKGPAWARRWTRDFDDSTE